MRSWWVGALVATLLQGGCAIGPDYQRPAVNLPQQFPGQVHENHREKAATDIATQWWILFEDAQLTHLVNVALEHNTDLQQATARIEQAEAQLKQARAVLWPSVDIGANASRDRSSMTTGDLEDGGISNTFRGVASTSFEIDFWGKLRRASEAARAQALATQYAAEVVRQTVASAVAHSYFGAVILDLQIALSRDTLQARAEDVRLQRLRLEQGSIGRLDLEQTEGQRADAALQLRELERQRALLASQLGLLTGQPGINLPVTQAGRLSPPPAPPAGMPSQLLQRRPDVRQAEQLLIAAQAEIGVAKAAMFPNISLTGLTGSESAELSDLFRHGSGIWSLGFGLNLPLFDAGRRLAVTEQAKARQAEALAAYQGSVQSAFKDVVNALTNLETARTSLIDAATRERSALSSLEIAKKRYAAGYSGYLELLDSQRTWNSAQLQTLFIRQAEFDATIDLLKALGGGWSPDRV
jgi:multidrug efflux system outer membrane protein